MLAAAAAAVVVVLAVAAVAVLAGGGNISETQQVANLDLPLLPTSMEEQVYNIILLY